MPRRRRSAYCRRLDCHGWVGLRVAALHCAVNVAACFQMTSCRLQALLPREPERVAGYPVVPPGAMQVQSPSTRRSNFHARAHGGADPQQDVDRRRVNAALKLAHVLSADACADGDLPLSHPRFDTGFSQLLSAAAPASRRLRCRTSCAGQLTPRRRPVFACALLQMTSTSWSPSANIPRLMDALNLRLWLNFGDLKKGTRTLRVLNGGLITTGAAALPMPLYGPDADPTNNSVGSNGGGTLLPAGEGGNGEIETPSVKPKGSRDGVSLTKVHRGDKI